ncbi:MAG: hypothetical protein JXA33_07255 [Anaerolineae bacterium]|nr:hypothetical protein [Anaerolineae bacterium]
MYVYRLLVCHNHAPVSTIYTYFTAIVTILFTAHGAGDNSLYSEEPDEAPMSASAMSASAMSASAMSASAKSHVRFGIGGGVPPRPADYNLVCR